MQSVPEYFDRWISQMHNYLSCVFLFRKVLRPLFATIRTIPDYSHYSLFATIRYSGFPDTPEDVRFIPIKSHADSWYRTATVTQSRRSDIFGYHTSDSGS